MSLEQIRHYVDVARTSSIQQAGGLLHSITTGDHLVRLRLSDVERLLDVAEAAQEYVDAGTAYRDYLKTMRAGEISASQMDKSTALRQREGTALDALRAALAEVQEAPDGS